MSNLEVVSELVFCGSFRFWGGQEGFMTGGFHKCVNDLVGGDSYVVI